MCGQTCICLPLAWHPDTYTCCSGLIVLLPSVRRHPCHGEEPAAQYKRMFGETRRKLALPGFLSMKHMFLYCCPCYQEAGVCLLPISFSNCGKNRQEKSQRVESAHLICFGTYWLVSCQAFWFLYFFFKASKVRCWHWLTWLIAVCRDLRAACVSSLLSCTHFLRPWIWVISIYVCVPCKTVHSRQVTNFLFGFFGVSQSEFCDQQHWHHQGVFQAWKRTLGSVPCLTHWMDYAPQEDPPLSPSRM